jgi:hypothetical protein
MNLSGHWHIPGKKFEVTLLCLKDSVKILRNNNFTVLRMESLFVESVRHDESLFQDMRLSRIHPYFGTLYLVERGKTCGWLVSYGVMILCTGRTCESKSIYSLEPYFVITDIFWY